MARAREPSRRRRGLLQRFRTEFQANRRAVAAVRDRHDAKLKACRPTCPSIAPRSQRTPLIRARRSRRRCRTPRPTRRSSVRSLGCCAGHAVAGLPRRRSGWRDRPRLSGAAADRRGDSKRSRTHYSFANEVRVPERGDDLLRRLCVARNATPDHLRRHPASSRTGDRRLTFSTNNSGRSHRPR